MDPQKKAVDSVNVANELETFEKAVDQFSVFVHYEDDEEAHPGTIYLGADDSLILIYADGRDIKGMRKTENVRRALSEDLHTRRGESVFITATASQMMRMLDKGIIKRKDNGEKIVASEVREIEPVPNEGA